MQITSKRTSSNDWKLKSADCKQVSCCIPSSQPHIELKLTILKCLKVGATASKLCLGRLMFDRKFTVVLQNYTSNKLCLAASSTQPINNGIRKEALPYRA